MVARLRHGICPGWSEAALEALANVYDRYRDLGWAKELIFPGIDPDDDLSVLVDELMDEYVRECGDEPEQRKSAYEETPYSLGKRGEDAAVRYLKANDYEILERNWFCPFGEADIIALDPDGVICFIEVKTRRGEGAGVPEEAVTLEKRRKYENIALSFLANAWTGGEATVRFDAIGISVTGAVHALLRHPSGYLNGVR